MVGARRRTGCRGSRRRSRAGPIPVVRAARARRSPAATEHATSTCRSFSTQRKAGMSSFDPSRIPAWLAPVCEERSGSHSTSTCEPSPSQRAMRRRMPVAHRPLQHRQREPVDLEEDDPRRVGHDPLARAARDSLDDAQRVDVVVVRPEQHREHDADRGRDERDAERRPERVDRETVADAVGRGASIPASRNSTRKKPSKRREREPQRSDERRQHRVEQGDDRRRDERRAEASSPTRRERAPWRRAARRRRAPSRAPAARA